jgi:hypothetical protein
MLLSEKREPFVSDSLAHAYYVEAKLCWISGAYVSTIIMTQLAFEESLRAFFRTIRQGDPILKEDTTIDRAGFFDLVEQAKDERWISTTEATALHTLRKLQRNPYVHPKQVEKGTYCPDEFLRRIDAFAQAMKLHAPSFNTGSVIAEAQDAIQLLLHKFPAISSRLHGHKYSKRRKTFVQS